MSDPKEPATAQPRHISDILAELAKSAPQDVREAITTGTDEPGLPLGYEGIEVVEP